MTGMAGLNSRQWAPMSPMRWTRTAVIFPSLSAASSMSCTWPRPWTVATALTERSSTHRTGRFSVRAMARQNRSSL